MKWILRCGVPALLLLLLGGCANGFRSPLLNLKTTLTAPFGEDERMVPVIYPYEEERQKRVDDPLAEAYGPAWQDLHGRYREYQFN